MSVVRPGASPSLTTPSHTMHARDTRAFALLVCVALTTGCATGGALVPRALDDTFAQHAGRADDDPKDADAVVLRREHRWQFFDPPGRRSSGAHSFYEATRILDEAAFSEASTHVVVPSGGRLASLKARTITPKGEFVDVDTASVLADAASFGKSRVETRSFQFPRVEVGSILEISWVVEFEDAWWTVSDYPSGKYPVKDYRVEIILDRFVTPDLLVNNTKIPLDYKKDNDGTQHVSFQLKDLPKRSNEWARPNNTEIYPWWAYRAIEWKYPAYTQPGVTNWSRALGMLWKPLVKEEGVDGVAALRGAEGCAGRLECIVDAALATTREKVVLTGFSDSFDTRSLADVQRAGTANNHEKALYLWRLLKNAGVDAHLAVMAMNHGQVNDSFPTSTWMDHTLVQVADPATKKPLWLDPSCEHCARGQVPQWSLGSRATTLSVVAGQYGNELSASPFATVEGTPAPEDLTERSFVVRVDASGDVDVEETTVESGGAATDTHIDTRTKTQKDADDEALKIVRRYSTTAKLLEAKPAQCDRAKGTCTTLRRSRLPGWGTLDEQASVKGTLLLPLSMLGSAGERALRRDEPRTNDIVFRRSEALAERIRIVPPSGYHVERRGLPLTTAQTEGLEVRAEATDDRGALVVTRHHMYHPGRWPKEQWAALKKTMAASSETARYTIAIVPDAPATSTTPMTSTTSTISTTPTTPTTSSTAGQQTGNAPRTK